MHAAPLSVVHRHAVAIRLAAIEAAGRPIAIKRGAAWAAPACLPMTILATLAAPMRALSNVLGLMLIYHRVEQR